MPWRWLPSLVTFAALLLTLLIWTEKADARLGDGLGFAGADAAVSFAIGSVIALDDPLPRAVAEPSYPGNFPGGSLGELFSRGDVIGRFAAGFLGSGVIGLLFGHGLIGELSGVASVFGLLFQLALIAMLARLIWFWWHDKKVDGLADLSPRQLADAYGRPRHEARRDVESDANLSPALDETVDDGLSHPK
jgi:hypothetical protein